MLRAGSGGAIIYSRAARSAPAVPGWMHPVTYAYARRRQLVPNRAAAINTIPHDSEGPVTAIRNRQSVAAAIFAPLGFAC